MQPLEKPLRTGLEGTVTDARTIAENAGKDFSNYSYSGGEK